MSGLSSRCVPMTMSTLALGELLDDLGGLLVGLEPRQALEDHREAGHPLAEGREVLLDQQRRRHEYGDLLAVLHRLERRTDRDLGLAVADVAADQPVHRDLRSMSRLTSSTVESWSGVSTNGKASSSSRCQGLSGPKACPRVACRAAYSLISSAAISLDRLAGAALALGPVGAAEPVERWAARRRRSG